MLLYWNTMCSITRVAWVSARVESHILTHRFHSFLDGGCADIAAPRRASPIYWNISLNWHLMQYAYSGMFQEYVYQVLPENSTYNHHEMYLVSTSSFTPYSPLECTFTCGISTAMAILVSSFQVLSPTWYPQLIISHLMINLHCLRWNGMIAIDCSSDFCRLDRMITYD
jgi:hypothetical protein